MSHLPSPPLSSSSAASNPWSTPRHRHHAGASEEMSLSIGSAAGLEASWRDMGEKSSPPALGAASLDGGEYLRRRAVTATGKPILAVQVMAKLMDSSNGRDKFLKCVQYTLKTYLYILSLPLPALPLPPSPARWLSAHRRRLSLCIASLSLVRKCLLLLNPLRPLASLLSPAPMSPRQMILHLVDLAGAIADDLVCLARIALLRRTLGQRAEAWANRFWLLTTLIGLYKLHFTEHETTSKTKEQVKEAKWTNRKLLADLLFVSYDILDPHLPSPIRSILGEPLKCTTGLVSGFISLTKLYNHHWDASLGKG
ncbi:hypothetical protein I312_101622 [Cryptococcus bacillisporus CA1280]|uniref:uncharacterized protein n=1 Tax=Cryptococcus bacillisporus CA1280 TaxID=1296109 RepID=UPI0033662BDF